MVNNRLIHKIRDITEDQGVTIRNITKTRDGNVLIKIGKNENKTESFQVAIASALDDSGIIGSLIPKLSVGKMQRTLNRLWKGSWAL